MESGRKAWVVGILACLFIVGAGLWIRTASANKSALAPAPAKSEASQDFTLTVVGHDTDIHFTDARDLPDAPNVEAGNPVLLAKGDMDLSGHDSLVGLYNDSAGTSQLRVRVGSIETGFSELAPVGLNVPLPTAMVIGDFNGDGKPDVAIGGSAGITFMFGDGHGGFLQGPELAVDGGVTALAAGDFNRDGRTDLAVASRDKVYVYLNDNADLSQLKPATTLTPKEGEAVEALAVADFNNDHYSDIAAATGSKVFVAYGSGGANFVKPKEIGNAAGITGIVAHDFSKHYVPDLAVSGATGVTIWKTKMAKGFAAGRTYSSGGALMGLQAGYFNSDDYADLAVRYADGSAAVMLNKKGNDFSEPKLIQVKDGAVSVLSGFHYHGVDSIAVGRHGGVAITTAAAGSTIVVTTTSDDDLCETCDSAQLAAFGANLPAGATGVSFREALTAANNDSLLPTPIVDDEIVFTGITSAPTTAKAPISHVMQTQSTCILPVTDGGNGLSTPGVNTYWLLNTSAHGTLPPIIASGLTIDGSQVNTTSIGVNNTLGPKVVVSSVNVTQQGAFLLITSSASGATIENLSLVGALGDAIQVAAENVTITGNNIGLDCAGSVEGNGDGSGVNTGSGVDFLSGSVNESVTNNFIGNNGTIDFPGGFAGTTSNEGTTVNPAFMTGSNGITINGVSQSISTPQGNVIEANTIGLDSHGRQAHNTGDGVMLQNGAVGNTIKNNTISASATSQITDDFATNDPEALIGFGVDVEGNITADAVIENNKIGTDPTGQFTKDANGLTIGNEHSGVGIGVLTGNPKFNTVSGNVISGNGFEVQIINFGTPNTDTNLPPTQTVTPQAEGDFNGVGISMSSADDNEQENVVATNLIGVNASGSVQIPNATGGMLLAGLANNNTIGGAITADANQISGNNGPGITLIGFQTEPTIAFDPNNNVFQDNEIGPNSLGAGGGPPLDQAVTSPQTSNKGGGVFITSGVSETLGVNGPFANRFVTNIIAFNSSSSADVALGGDPITTSAGIEDDSNGNFNTFTQNQIFLNPPNAEETVPTINDDAGQQGMRNAQILVPTSPDVITSLINITSATTINAAGQTTITGTVDFLDNPVVGAS
ncbi:MAG TPA: VCBS repeat-containing protein, partial [Blastocatellia bacterium]